MKYSRIFGKTVRSVPSDLKSISHKLFYQGGFIRQVAAGRYVFLPLGFRVWQKIKDIIEEEMQVLGSQRIITPSLHPIEIWQKTNRDQAFGEEMFIVDDHHGARFALGATAEGLMVELVKQFFPSYKQLPIYIHQFGAKFRDEKRPKGGLLRVREFIMKDAYSFDKTEKDLEITYQKFYDSYHKIAKRFDLNVIPVLAESGAIGGDYNHEFFVKSKVGEGEALLCDICDYAAHVERAVGGFKNYQKDSKTKETKEYYDTEAVTCEVLARNMGIPLHKTTKTILFKSGQNFIAAMVRGDYELSETKLKRHLGVDYLELAGKADIKELTGAEIGFLGPLGLPKSVKIIADFTCQDRVNFEVGGNKTGVHIYNVNYERDLKTPEFAEIREARSGDACLSCKKGKLKKIQGIEWGHSFKLDQFYTKPHRGIYVDEKGSEKVMWMGSYGIGLGRSMAAIAETHHDDKGLIWPRSVAPYQVHLISLAGTEKEAKSIYQRLKSVNVEVLWDDRDESAGVKFADSDLIGIPYRFVVSPKTKGKIEVKKRDSKDIRLQTLEEAIKSILV